MKPFATIVAAVALLGLAATAHAQASPADVAAVATSKPTPKPASQARKLEARPTQNSIVMKGGKLLLIRQGSMMPMTTEMTLENGTKVALDGTLTLPDGTTKTLANGDYLLLDGRIVDGGKLAPAMKKNSVHE